MYYLKKISSISLSLLFSWLSLFGTELFAQNNSESYTIDKPKLSLQLDQVKIAVDELSNSLDLMDKDKDKTTSEPEDLTKIEKPSDIEKIPEQ